MTAQHTDTAPECGQEPTVQRVPSVHLDTLFNYLVKCIKEDGAPPTYDEIGKALGYSKGLVARRVKQLHELGRIVIDEEKTTARTMRIAKGQGHDELVDKVYLTEDRKAIIKVVKSMMKRTGIGPSINMLAHELGFSNSKTKRHVEYLDTNELLRYSPELGEVIAIEPGDYESKPNA
ncbi:DNA-binding protein [Providencia rettgeri]|uniref:DNA-binding protein n=1 Tax=Providencia rettgeri TaxID=587 RepID=A0AAP2NUQ9_PRORE|nr:DNA-binding protein [Providencia rettgeri]ELI9034853.1 DNA-binding protein [Morganella morganii]MBX6949547.1 DNA-binding protein [Providencia rettgeri]MBX6956361.1 DNA-binding protein [Providencia rettgeri]MBX6958299.1 DNA-binding protein [Providencia rettgeri]MBX6971302.1 DNA-binding protein [Providencia rettgeri]